MKKRKIIYKVNKRKLINNNTNLSKLGRENEIGRSVLGKYKERYFSKDCKYYEILRPYSDKYEETIEKKIIKIGD